MHGFFGCFFGCQWGKDLYTADLHCLLQLHARHPGFPGWKDSTWRNSTTEDDDGRPKRFTVAPWPLRPSHGSAPWWWCSQGSLSETTLHEETSQDVTRCHKMSQDVTRQCKKMQTHWKLIGNSLETGHPWAVGDVSQSLHTGCSSWPRTVAASTPELPKFCYRTSKILLFFHTSQLNMSKLPFMYLKLTN